jgi:hypothetical protein
MIYAQQDTDMDGNQEDSDLPRTYYWDNNVNFPDNVYLHPNVGNDTIAPYVMNAILKSTVNYTFSYGFQFMEDDKVSVSVISTTPCNVYLFSITDPSNQSFSKAFGSNNLGNITGNVNWTIQEDGLYILLVMSQPGCSSGRCTVSVGSQTFSNVYIDNNLHACSLDTNHEYNIFTNRASEDFYLCAFTGSSPGRVIAYNDNYQSTGDFSWGNRSRIKSQFTYPVTGVAVLPKYVLNSSTAPFLVRYADLYIGGKKDLIVCPYFPNLDEDDVIRTAPPTYDLTYNCISWAGGEWLSWEWPLSYTSQYYDTDSLTAFDKFFNAHGFTRTGATAANSAVDLWARNGEYTHASVKNKAHKYATGYAWESKAGALSRFMHPRYSLEGDRWNDYGHVVAYYTPINEFVPNEFIYENSSFSQQEINKIDLMKSNLSSSVISSFNNLYQALKGDTTYYRLNDISKHTLSPYYTQLLTMCLNDQNVIALAYEKLNEGDILSSVLIKGVTLAQNADVIQQVHNYNDSITNNTSLRRTNLSNTIMYTKGVLAKQMSPSVNPNSMFEDITYSNDERIFNVKTNGHSIRIDFSLPSTCNTQIFISSGNGQYVRTILNEKLSSGIYYFSANVPSKGIYTIHITLNGRIYSRKIQVK